MRPGVRAEPVEQRGVDADLAVALDHQDGEVARDAAPISRRRACVASKSRSSLSRTPPSTIPATPIARARVSVSADAREPPTRIRPVAPTSIAPARSSSAGSRDGHQQLAVHRVAAASDAGDERAGDPDLDRVGA